MNDAVGLGKRRILLVEDSEDDYLLVEGFLPEDAFALTWSRSAREARARLAGERFDLVLLDLGLPDVNGLSLLEEIRSRHPDHRVIVLTGRDDRALAVSAMKMGAHTYLLKDEILDHLVDTLEDALPLTDASPRQRADTKPRFADTVEHFYQIVLETMDEGCVVVDAQGLITFANRALDGLVRCDAKSLPGRSVLELFDQASAGHVREGLDRLAAGLATRSLVMEAALAAAYARVPESVASVRIAMRRMPSRTGRYESSLLILTDISELLQAKQLLAELYLQEKAQHGQLRAILESSRDGILLVDRELRVRVINGPVGALLALPGGAERWAGRSLLEMMRALGARGAELARAALGEIRRIRSGDESPGGGEVKLGARVVRWLDLPVQGDQSRLLVLQDVTAESTLQQMREDLVHMAVHDLRNPLNVMSQSLEYVQQITAHGGSEDVRPWIDLALGGVRRMLVLVNAILDANRLESGEMPLELRSCSLIEIMRRAVLAQAPMAAGRRVLLTCDGAPDGATARIDPELIDRVLQNLLDNAIRSTPPGGAVVLRADTWPARDGAREAAPAEYCLIVADEGPGIPPDLQERLFERFVTGRRHGVGLGLAFCKLAVEAHGGRIWAESTPARGAMFRFTVPAAD